MSESRTQWYIGAPNGVVLCVNRIQRHEPVGLLYHSYREEGIPFGSFSEMTQIMEELYDWLRFPHPGTNSRSFVPTEPVRPDNKERKKTMDDEVLLSKHGDIGTFIVRVQHRQNSSWQGRVTWMDKDQTVSFRSVWELIKLIESAVDTVSEQEDGKDATWALDPDES